jgi:EAL domain-containing protein (putative c-di-GMP-specific phosphodiesterase class I)
MLDTAFARLQADPALRLTLNVCRTSLVEPRWRTQVETLSSAAPAAAARLTLEITEWPHRAAALPLAEALHGLSALGVSLWLDDFGSGLTSVNEALLPTLSGIKIDRSLIRHSLANGDRLGLVAAISGLARRQGKTCIAEGAENEDERAFAETLGATHVQGFFSGVI